MVYCMKICEQGAKMFENTYYYKYAERTDMWDTIYRILESNFLPFPFLENSTTRITIVVVHTNIMRLHTGFDLSVESVDLWIFPLVSPI